VDKRKSRHLCSREGAANQEMKGKNGRCGAFDSKKRKSHGCMHFPLTPLQLTSAQNPLVGKRKESAGWGIG